MRALNSRYSLEGQKKRSISRERKLRAGMKRNLRRSKRYVRSSSTSMISNSLATMTK